MNAGISASGCVHCGKILLLAASLDTSAAAAGEPERGWVGANRGRLEIMMKVTQRQSKCVTGDRHYVTPNGSKLNLHQLKVLREDNQFNAASIAAV